MTSLVQNVIEYNPYTNKEMTGILSMRIAAGLYPGVFSKDLLETIVENCFDLRQAIECIKKSALLAESDAMRAVKEKHVMKFLDAAKTEKKTTKDYDIRQDKIDNTILEILKQGELETSQLFAKVKKHTKNYSKFYRILRAMEKHGSIEIKKLRKGQGWSSIILLKK